MVTSLDRPVGEEEDTSLGSFLASGELPQTEEVEISLREDALHKALERLPEQSARSSSSATEWAGTNPRR